MPDDKIIEKIRTCWRLAEHPNTPQHEKEAALTRAHELMARHQVDMAVIQEKEGKREAVILQDIRITEDGRNVVVADQRIFLAAVVAKRNRCQCVIRKQPETADVETGKRIPGGSFFTVVGFESDVEFVKELYWQLNLAMLTAMRGEAVQTKNYQANFCDGFVSRIDDRLQALNNTVHEELAPQGSSTALVLVSRELEVKKEFDERFPKLGRQVVQKIKHDPNAQERGRIAANKTDIGQTKIGGGGSGSGNGQGSVGSGPKGLGRG